MKELRKISQKELREILELHKLWLETDGEEGARADLSYYDLRNADLRYADLRYADLFNTNLFNTNLSYCNLSYANLNKANLSCADLNNADLFNTNLSYCNLRYANLTNADLSYTELYETNLFYAKVDDMISIGNVGNENRTVYYCYKDDRGICGWFDDTLEEFKKAVKEKYGKDYGSYAIAIEVFEKMKDMK